MTPKIIELVIQDGDVEAGLDGIALVEMPAHEANFEYFSDQEKSERYVLSDEEIPEVIQMFHSYGEPQGLLEKEGWFISEVKNVGKQDFQIISNPDESSAQDTTEVRYRYKYVGPRDPSNRTFCAEMMSAGKVFRIEDIMTMSDRSINPVGPSGYDMFTWRGSYNCRHRWVQLIYRREGRIINSDEVERGLIDTDNMPGPDTRTTATINAGNTPPRVGFGKEKMEIDVSSLPPYTDEVGGELIRKPVLASLPLFDNKADAEAMAQIIGCKGCHEHQYGDVTLYMPCERHPEDMSKNKVSFDFDDTLSTKRGKDLAKKLMSEGDEIYITTRRQEKDSESVYKVADELGIPHSRVHFTNGKLKWQLLKELGINVHYDNNPDEIKAIQDKSPEIKAIHFGSMAVENIEPDYDIPDVSSELFSFDDYPELIRKNAKAALDYIEKTGNPKGCMTQVGKVRAQQLAQGKPISIDTVKRMKAYITRHKKDLQASKSYDDGCGKLAMDAWGGVEALPWIESTIKKYEEMSAIGKETIFSVFNSEQRLVVGAAMIPDKMIIRRNEITGEIYYVYFTAETILKLQQKFMMEKLLDKTNIEHSRRFLSNVDVVESWIVEDPEKDKQQVFGMDYPKGTWMCIIKVNDDNTWQMVKDGKLKGFSVQGYFLEKAKFNAHTHQVLDEIKQILKEVK